MEFTLPISKVRFTTDKPYDNNEKNIDMTRKLFISFLGTGFYQECIYHDKEHDYQKSRFIQCATLEQIGAKQWGTNDAVRIFITDSAKTANWSKTITTRQNFKTKEEMPYTGLETEIEKMQLKANVAAVHGVPDGKDEAEMWQIFQIVFDEIEEGDELFIDLTHAFRYLPMLVLVLSNYAKFLKHVSVRHLSYGNYEARTNDNGVEKAPIVDLMPLTMLQDWTTASSEFLKYGYVKQLAERTKSTLLPLLRDVKTRAEAKPVKMFVDLLTTYAIDRLTCRGLNIENGDTAKRLNEVIAQIKTTGIKPLDPVFEEIRRTISTSSDATENCLQAARWCFERNLYQQAATLLREGVVSYFCRRHDIPTDDKDKRELVSKAMDIKYNGTTKENWKVEEEYFLMIDGLLKDEMLNKEVASLFINIRDVRNDFNHAGFRCNAVAPNKIVTNIEKAINTYLDLLKGTAANKGHTPIFLNLSNHPSGKWDEEQTAAARRFGAIADFPFPNIEPTATEGEIERLAEETLQQIAERYAGSELTVHVMGEMTFTFALVARLKERGIRCVASCTERMTEEREGGEKLSTFRFVGFRKY